MTGPALPAPESDAVRTGATAFLKHPIEGEAHDRQDR
jgi:hypothetical protein